MSKLFLYGRTKAKNRIEPYAKLTVNCPPNITVRVESVETSDKLDVNSGSTGKAVFEQLSQGNWNITFVNVEYPPSRLLALDSIDYEITITPTAARTYAMRRSVETVEPVESVEPVEPVEPVESVEPVEPEVEYNVASIEESFSATIRVTYPEGSVCICSNAQTVLSASDRSGYYEFVVPHFGEWTVSCVSGKHSKNTAVSIFDNEQIEEVVVDYATYLYKAGVECVTWSMRDNDDLIGPSYITATKQDLSKTDVLYVNCIPSAGVSNGAIVCIRDNNNVVDNLEEDCLAYAQLNSEDGTLELDVSNFSGRYFIEIFYSGAIDSVYCL